MIVSILDYGAGNIHSLRKALSLSGVDLRVDTDPLTAIEADALVLPGVGGFAHAAEYLAASREQIRARIQSGLPTLGICLGMQLFFDTSDEGPGRGLGILPGHVSRLQARQVPQIGWNTVDPVEGEDLFSAESLETAYFAHSFVCRDAESDSSDVLAWTTHESDRFPSAVRVGSAVGVQFHPEKSSQAGVRWLARWVREAARAPLSAEREK